jgi:GTP-binding protein HflX
MRSPVPAPRPAIIVAVQTPDLDDGQLAASVHELTELLAGLGIRAERTLVQRRPNRAAPTYVGEGKLKELARCTGGTGELRRGPEPPPAATPGGVDLVVADDELTPAQQRNLELATGAEVLDRTAVILEVFARRARTSEAVLEVELARLSYQQPRVRDDRSLGDREGGGGRASRGHTNVELAKQRLRVRSAEVREKLERLQAAGAERRIKRADLPRVSIVGYTNAGKSTLMNALTGSEVWVEDKLFATLGTTVRQLAPPTVPPILVVDTVGFLRRLPHALIASFRSTLAEAGDAWLLLHVADASDPQLDDQVRVTREVIAGLGVVEAPVWLLLNKADRLSSEEKAALGERYPEATLLSAVAPAEVAALRERVVGFCAQRLITESLELPYAARGVVESMRDELEVLSETFGDRVGVTVRGTAEAIGRLRRRLS